MSDHIDFNNEMIRELEAVKNSIDSMSTTFKERMSSLEDRIESSIEITKGQMKGKYELLEQELNGQGKRFDDKVAINETRLQVVETSESECPERRAKIHERIDKLEDGKVQENLLSIITLGTYMKITWGILCGVGAAVAWTIIAQVAG